MLEFYDKSPHSLSVQKDRLRAAQILSQAGIQCLIYGEDALAFIHFVPTELFAMHIIVANQDIHHAAAEILGSLPYRVFTDIHNHFNDGLLFDPNRTRAFPNSTFLESTTDDINHPDMIIVHPESDFNLVISNYSRSVPLPPFPDSIRFPTRAAFLDSAIETRLDPNSGLVTQRATDKLNEWISYVLVYTLRSRPILLPNGDLNPEAEALKCSLKPENQPQVDAYLRLAPKVVDRSYHMTLRREILRRMGQLELANRPLPRLPPGNPAYLKEKQEKHRADRARQQEQSMSRVTTPSSIQSRSYSTIAMRGVSSSIKLARKFIR